LSKRHALHAAVAAKRRTLSGKLDIRWLDFAGRQIHVEANGQVILEGATEMADKVLAQIPEFAKV
jgi:hypothetical protein